MATIKKPSADDGVTAQTEGGKHPRGVDSKNYKRQEDGKAQSDVGAAQRSNRAGKHLARDSGGPNDLERNPGIGSSKGTGTSGESGIEERDRGRGPGPGRQ